MSHMTHQPIKWLDFTNQNCDASCGGIVTFSGVVRNHHEGRAVLRMEYEGYESMADKQIDLIAGEAKEKFGVKTVRVIHRLGKLEIGDIAVAIEVTSAHRAEAFDACRYVIDEIKIRVPIWKHEFYADGANEWVLCHHGKKEKHH